MNQNLTIESVTVKDVLKMYLVGLISDEFVARSNFAKCVMPECEFELSDFRAAWIIHYSTWGLISSV